MSTVNTWPFLRDRPMALGRLLVIVSTPMFHPSERRNSDFFMKNQFGQSHLLALPFNFNGIPRNTQLMRVHLRNADTSNKAGIIKGQKNLWYHRSRFFRVQCRFLLSLKLPANQNWIYPYPISQFIFSTWFVPIRMLYPVFIYPFPPTFHQKKPDLKSHFSHKN